MDSIWALKNREKEKKEKAEQKRSNRYHQIQ